MAMSVDSRGSTDVLIPRKWCDDDDHPLHQRREVKSPDQTSKIRIEPSKAGVDSHRKVPVIYYLSRNGQLEHPHFVQVPLSSSHGLYLRDVINRLKSLRGDGMGFIYSWSSKRSYKNGYVWQDLSEDDFIHPTNGHDYVLKGSEALRTSICETASSETKKFDAPSVIAAARRRKNQSWSSFEIAEDRSEYIVLKCESSREFAGKCSMAADAATQTEEKRYSTPEKIVEEHGSKSVELSREDLSPPPSMSSSEGSDGVSGSGDVDGRVDVGDPTADNEYNSIGKMKSPTQALMHFISCGPLMGFKKYGPMKKSNDSKTKARLQR